MACVAAGTYLAACAGTEGDNGARARTAAPAPQTMAWVAPAGSAAEAKKAPERSLESLAEDGKIVAAGMRTLKGEELSGQREIGQELIARADVDTCVRVAFSAGEAVVAQLADEKGRILAETPRVTDGKLGERGPVCARRGETLRVQFMSPGDVVVRFVAWTSR